MTVLIGCTLRNGRKIVKQMTLTKEQVEILVVDAFQNDVSKAFNCFPTLKQGNTFKFKWRDHGVTLSPLNGHIDNY